MNDEPQTLQELCDYIVRHADAIFVRRQCAGIWGPHSLAKLSTMDALTTALGWIKDGRIPVRVRSVAEIGREDNAQ